MPILIAPTALPGLAHPEGEIVAAKAAGAQKAEREMAEGRSAQAVVPPKAPIKAENLIRRLRTEE